MSTSPPAADRRLRRRFARPLPMALAGVLVAATGALVPVLASGAEPACSVDYTVTGQWDGGFQGAVAVTNLVESVTSWTLTFELGDGQKVTQGWNADWSQSGTTVTVKAPGWSQSLATGATATAGFLGSRSSTEAPASPTSFQLNGKPCVSGVDTTPSPSATAEPTFSESASPTATPTTTATATPSPTPTSTDAADEWNPPADLVKPLDEVWNHMASTYPDIYGFKNYGFDQVMANGGSINYCVRWESDNPVSASLRDRIESQLQKQFGKWMAALTENGRGYNDWPYATVPVKVVGWAVKDRSLLQWNDDSVDIYVNNLDDGGAPQCAPPCGRFFHQDGDYSQCPGGAARHYDQSLWLTKGMGFGGAGGDWGQRVDQEYFTGALDAENVHIYLHEVGHTFGLDDFYDWTPTGVGGFIMNAGSATEITTFDKWMLRDFWRHIKDRYGY
ncbi:cellulose binding domain-containing protein [Streptomyces sp. NPDC002896]|uniref:cellulose-binding domain-containing protein n=1 Tax=Streptomyces sp. NPDC002896 TaxID=3154438 RepID=UPI00332283A3